MMSEYAANAGLPALRPAMPVIAHSSLASYVVASGTLATIIQRIEETIDSETVAIKSDPRFDLKASNARKSRALYELAKAIKADGGPRLEHQTGIIRLQAKLAANESAIRAHLAAVNEVATLIQNAIQAAETDGTYSSMAFGKI